MSRVQRIKRKRDKHLREARRWAREGNETMVHHCVFQATRFCPIGAQQWIHLQNCFIECDGVLDTDRQYFRQRFVNELKASVEGAKK